METATASASPATARFASELKTMPDVRRNFVRRRSPWVIIAAIAAAAGVRLAIGDLGWADLVAVAAMLVIYPFGEWAIHVYLLHMKPFMFRGRQVTPLAARAHRTHHRHPNDLDQLLLDPWQIGALLFLAVPAVVAVGGAIVSLVAGGVPWGPLVTAVLTAYALVLGYEWTHFVIHTAYRPKTSVYRSVWRNHRLHHFKNEHFWHGVTNNLSDRVLGTNPDQREVERSQTARTLDGGPAR